MQKIDVETLLFQPLITDYKQAKSRNKPTTQLNLGFDLMEASLKFFAIYMLAVLKKEDEEKYKEVFSSFRTRSTLGNYYFLLVGALSVEVDNKFYNDIQNLFLDKFDNPVSLDLASSILEGKRVKSKDFFYLLQKHDIKPYKINNLFAYALNIRNVIKGHSATLKEDDRLLSILILKNMDKMLWKLETIVKKLLSLDGVEICLDTYINTLGTNTNYKEHKFQKIIMQHEEDTYSLSPMLAYIECDIYSCRKKHRTKIFFINEVENSKSYYLDYLYNHHWRINTSGNDWKINTFQKEVKTLFEEVKLAYSNENKYTELVANFVGRQKELQDMKNFILDNYNQNTISVVSGKPGIGKSSYVTKLQSLISEEKDDIVTYLFYAIKNQNTDNDLKYFADKFSQFLQKNKIVDRKKIKAFDSEESELAQLMMELSKSDKTLLLIIDGLDELNNTVAFLQNLQLERWKQGSKVHLILTTRPYKNILKTIASILLEHQAFCIYKSEEIEEHGYSFALDSLSISETQSLIQSLVPKEIDIEDEKYKEIIATIIDKSERLPIYIHFISQNLKDHDLGAHDDYLAALTNWSKKLPKKLENYYLESFKEISSLSRKILITLFYSPYGASLAELYILLAPEQIDNIEFEQKYFLPIEMFLRELENNIFGFYHLSVKDAIFAYYIKTKEIIVFDADQYIANIVKEDENLALIFKDSGYKDEISHFFDEFYEINMQRDFAKTVKSVIGSCTEKIEEQSVERFLNKNFFFMYYSYCTAIIASSVGESVFSQNAFDMKSIRENSEVKHTIKQFFYLFDKYASKESTAVIDSAYKLSKMVKDHQRTLKYYDLYRQVNLETFVRICSNLDKPENIQEFKDRLIDWEENLLVEQKDILVEMMKYTTLITPEYRELVELLEFKYSAKLRVFI